MSPPYRTCLYVGADREDLVALVERAGVDAALVDLEDAVAPGRKAAGRERAAELLAAAPECDVLIRVNPLGGDDVAADVELCDAGARAFVFPMLRRPEEVREADRLLAAAEARAGLAAGSVGLIPMLETPRAVLTALDLLDASPRVTGTVFGPNDYVAEIGANVVAPHGFAYHPDIDVGHALVVAAASAAGVWCMTPALVRLDDLAELDRQARSLYARGYDGVIVVDPAQVGTLRDADRPAAETLAFAQGVVDAFDASAETGTPKSHEGWFVYEGPFLTMARAVVEAARRHA